MRPETFDFAEHFADTRFYFEIDGMPDTARTIVGWRGLVEEYATRFFDGSPLAEKYLARTFRWTFDEAGLPVESVLGTADLPTPKVVHGLIRVRPIGEVPGDAPMAALARAKAEVEETRRLYASGMATSEALKESVKRFVESTDAAFSSSPQAPPPAGETRSATSTEYADREPIGWRTSITMPPEAWILAAFVVSIVTFLGGFGLGIAL